MPRFPAFSRIVFVLLALMLAAPASAAVFYPTSFTLGNGLQVVVVPNHLAPAVTQMVWYKVGSIDEKPGKTGLAHYLEHLMFRGTANIGPGEFSKLIAAQGGEDNAFTSYDYTAFHETVAADRLPMIMQMEADRMHNLRIVPETAGPELRVVLEERQQRTDNDPGGLFEEKTRHLLMPHDAYGRPVIGWRGEIEKLTAADARDFYEHHYAPNNAVVIISGDVTPDEVMRLAAAIYGAVPRRDVTPRFVPPLPEAPTTHQFTMKDPRIEQAEIQFNAVVPSYRTQQNNEAYAFEVLAEALDDGEVGLLYRNLVKQQGIADAVQAQYDPDDVGSTTFTIGLTPRPGKKPEDLAKALTDELHKLAQQGLDPDTVDTAKQRLQRSAIFARDSLMMPGYAFGSALTTGHAVSDVEDWPDRIGAVAPDDVNMALRDLADNPRALVSLLLPDRSKGAHVAPLHPLTGHDMGIR